MIYCANSDRYSEMDYRACGRSGPAARAFPACGTISGTPPRLKDSVRSCARRSTSGSRILTLPTTTGLRKRRA